MAKEKPLEEGASEVPSGTEMLDDLLRQLNEDQEEAGGAGPSAPPEASEVSAEPERGSAEAGTLHEEATGDGGGTEARPQPIATPEELPASEQRTVSDRLLELTRSLDLAIAENGSLREALAQQHSIETDLRRELTQEREARTAAQTRLTQASHRFVPAAPVAFLAADGRTIVRRAFYTLGRGEALEELLGGLFARWTASGASVVPSFDRGTVSLTASDDPQGRSVRLLSSGIVLVRLSAKELAELGELPPLVRSKHPPSSAAPPG